MVKQWLTVLTEVCTAVLAIYVGVLLLFVIYKNAIWVIAFALCYFSLLALKGKL